MVYGPEWYLWSPWSLHRVDTGIQSSSWARTVWHYNNSQWRCLLCFTGWELHWSYQCINRSCHGIKSANTRPRSKANMVRFAWTTMDKWVECGKASFVQSCYRQVARVAPSRFRSYAIYCVYSKCDVVWLNDSGSNALVNFDSTKQELELFPLSAPNTNVRQILDRPD